MAEKTKWYGGTSAFSGGALCLPMNPLSLAERHSDCREQAESYLRNYLKDDCNDVLISAYLDSAPEMVKWLEAKSATRFIPCNA